MQFDILIQHGCIYDGTSPNPNHCDIGINGSSIARMDDLAGADAKLRVDASGMIVCPGFIDSHSHSDTYLLIEPSAASKIYQGITTEICGNCGASAAPLNGAYKMPSDWLDKEYAKPWKTVAEYRERYAEACPAINAALLVGHNTLHAGICGYEPRGGSPDEMKAMKSALAQALEEGVIGLSSGLAYPPGSAVPREEIIELAQTVAARGGLYTTHMRSESAGLIEAIDEAIDIAERSGCRLQISHLKASGKGNWHRIDAAFDRIRSAQNRIQIGADRYPYTASSTDLDILLPTWATYGGRDAILARIRNPESRRRLLEELNQNPSDYWDNVMVGSTRLEAFKGKYLPEVATDLGMDRAEAFLYLIDSDDLKTGGIFFSMSETNLWRVLAEPYVSIGSDGSMRAPWGPLGQDHPHPRAYGSHTRFLRAALDGKTVPLAEAIHKMTGLPAEQFGLAKRGVLKEGNAADVLVFDPAAIKEKTTYARPHQLSEGMRHIFVNGIHTLAEGRPTGMRGGTFLPRSPRVASLP